MKDYHSMSADQMSAELREMAELAPTPGLQECYQRAAALLGGAQDAPEADIDKLRSVFEAAYGLCHGYDWNNGTAAKACGYRRKLLSAVNAIRPVPDFEGKYASPMTEGSR